MTISQSRFGLNAEVGRSPSRPARERDRYGNAVLGSTAASVAGAGMAAYGFSGPRRALNYVQRMRTDRDPMIADRNRAYAAYKDAQRKHAKYAYLRGPVEMHNRRIQANDAVVRDFLRNGKSGLISRGKVMGGVGLGVAVAGAAGAAAAHYLGEKKRGTLGYKRPTLAGQRQNQLNQRKAAEDIAARIGAAYRNGDMSEVARLKKLGGMS